MVYSLIFSPESEKQFSKIDKHQRKLINQWINTHLISQKYPRQLGKQLKVTLNNYWSYRINQYRLVCLIDDIQKTITIVSIGHRRDIYTRMVREPECLYKQDMIEKNSSYYI